MTGVEGFDAGGRGHRVAGCCEALLERALQQQREHADGDVGLHLGIGVVEDGTQLDRALDRLEVLLDDVLDPIELDEFPR